ncbi:MAG: hypothetical protein GF418_10870 [Chitinivibrionales bacterium]|nr:hypothetical protein [Chitinivibrionales bacterium]MBD3396117.1 hypothetical protein [Chitinivibrionales bacterium]
MSGFIPEYWPSVKQVLISRLFLHEKRKFLSSAGGISTVYSTEGKAEGGFWLGFREGLWDTWNEATGGFFAESIGERQGELRGEAHVRAYDLTGAADSITRAEAIVASKQFASYTWQGHAIRYGADVTWRGAGVDQEGSKGEQRYLLAYQKRMFAEGNIAEAERVRLRFGLEKIGYNATKNQGKINPQLGHALLGSVGSHYAVHDLFETYGEPYEDWNWEDEYDDWGLIHWLSHD